MNLLNWVEVVLWGVIGSAFAWRSITGQGRVRRDAAVLAGAFFAFGLSDYIELRTGAWWRPWWLAVWKVACVVVLVLVYLAWRKRSGPCDGRRE